MLFAKLNDLSIGGKGSYGIAASAVERKADLPTYLRITDIFDDGTLNLSELKSVDAPNSDKYILKPNDIVFARTGGSTGRNYFYDGSDGVFVYAGFLIKFSIDPEKVNPKYVKYYCRSKQYNDWVQSFNTGSTRGNINAQTFGNMEIPLPERKQQDYLVSILEPIDEKIRNNKQVNDNLQQQAFSVFDNLIANAENNDYTVSDYAFLNPKRTLAKNQVARSIDMSQLSTSGAFPSGWEMKPFNGGMRFTNGDTLLARITPCLENGKTAFIDFLDDGEVAFGSTEYIVLAPKNDTPPEMLYCLARYPAFVDFAVKNMNGSSGRQRVSAETVEQYRLPLFDKHSLVLFKEVVSPMFLKMRYNSLENMRLAELRDALLPKLMSGEIDISAVQL